MEVAATRWEVGGGDEQPESAATAANATEGVRARLERFKKPKGFQKYFIKRFIRYRDLVNCRQIGRKTYFQLMISIMKSIGQSLA
ncbi:MAG: hypothetical protein AB7D48_03285 [Acidocella sp.]